MSSTSKVLSSLASFPFFYGYPSSDQAFAKGPSLIPIVGNNTGGGKCESVLVKSIIFYFSYSNLYTLLQ